MPDATDHADVILFAAEHLRRGGLVAFPTETVYGLGADALNPDAVARVFAAKGRPSHNPLIVHVDGPAMAQTLVERWTADARKLAEAFWPGPLSIVLPKHASVPDCVTGGGPNVALRCPDHELARALIRATGRPLVGPSANKSGFVSPTAAEHVMREFPGAVLLQAGRETAVARTVVPLDTVLVLDGGPCSRGIESTVVKPPAAIGDRVIVLRPGFISADQIAAVLGRSVEVAPPTPPTSPDPASPSAQSHLDSPGLLDRHYAPRTPAFRFTAAQWPEVLELLLDLPAELQPGDGAEARSAVLTLGSRSVPSPHARVAMPTDPRQYAARLYAALREADDERLAAILIETPATNADPLWAAITDRVRRATVTLPSAD